MNCRGPLRDMRRGGRNTFTVGNGHHPGATPGRQGAGRPLPCADAWHWRAAHDAGKAGQLVTFGVMRPGKAPSISYMEGALFHSAAARSAGSRELRARLSNSLVW
jgi:hypothetical protein